MVFCTPICLRHEHFSVYVRVGSSACETRWPSAQTVDYYFKKTRFSYVFFVFDYSRMGGSDLFSLTDMMINYAN